jgi:transcriptional regulator with XRE-family HTH domain
MEQLKRLREAQGLSQTKLAARADVNPATVNQIEGGKRTASPATLHKLAAALDVSLYELLEGEPHPKADRSSLEPSLLNGLEDERRAQEDLGRELGRLEGLWGWKSYLTRRVEWCERVLQKSQEERFLNPFLSLDTAIQWAMYVGIESSQLQNALRTEIRSYGDADLEIVGELRALLDRFVAVDDTTNVRVKVMMDEAGLTDEDKEQRLRLIQGSAA